MAKKFADIFKKANVTIYKNPSMLLTIIAKMNSAAKIKEDLAPNGATDGSTSKFTLQRRVRNQVKAVANPNSGTTTDALKLLDSFDKVQWESTDLITGAAKSIGFKTTIKDNLDMDALNPLHADDITAQVQEIALDRDKTLRAAITSKAKTKAATYDVTLPDGTTETITVPALAAHVADKTDVWNSIASANISFSRIADKFKAKSTPVVFGSQEVALELTQEMGQVFNQEAPIAKTGFTSGQSINGVPFVIDPELVGRKVYLIDEESLVFKKSPTMEDVDQKLGTTRYVGKVFYDVLGVVDENRVWELS